MRMAAAFDSQAASVPFVWMTPFPFLIPALHYFRTAAFGTHNPQVIEMSGRPVGTPPQTSIVWFLSMLGGRFGRRRTVRASPRFSQDSE
jgi:hypothetical protein